MGISLISLILHLTPGLNSHENQMDQIDLVNGDLVVESDLILSAIH